MVYGLSLLAEFKKGFEKVRFYLELLGKEILSIDEERLSIVIMDKVDDVKIPIEIVIMKPGWVVIQTRIMSGDDVQRMVGSTHILYRELLRLSFRYPDFNFAMDDSYNIYAIQYIFLGALSFDVFEEELGAVPLTYYKFQKELLPEIKRIIEEEQKIEYA